jgi:hypothetical protein
MPSHKIDKFGVVICIELNWIQIFLKKNGM